MPPPQRTFDQYSFARHLQPSVNLSGDFVDYFVIDANHLGFYVADVSGHGIASGFVTVLLRSMVRRYVEQLQHDGDTTILSSARMLTRLNNDLCPLHLDKYLTIFYGVIDQVRNALDYSCGGHYPHPVLFDGERSMFVRGKGFPVGLFAEADYESSTLTMPKRFLLAVFSDGVLELLAGLPVELKHRRMLESIVDFNCGVMELLTTLGLQPGQNYPDDITLLTVRREHK
jgi:serine phosphatase RsbU (regulator of sigma subunit)